MEVLVRARVRVRPRVRAWVRVRVRARARVRVMVRVRVRVRAGESAWSSCTRSVRRSAWPPRITVTATVAPTWPGLGLGVG